MLEAQGNMWDFVADAYVITTNGFVKKNGDAVMGRGCALEAAQRWPVFPAYLGAHITENGNHTGCFIPEDGVMVFTMPVKHHWREKADPALIVRSARELLHHEGMRGLTKVVMPRPGCGNGQLSWVYVKPRIRRLLDDRFTVVTF